MQLHILHMFEGTFSLEAAQMIQIMQKGPMQTDLW